MNAKRTTPAPSSATPIYTVAVAGSPEILCPAWCVISKEDHLADLANQDGYVIHWSNLKADIRHSAVMTPDGTPDPTEEPLVFLDHKFSDGVSLDEAEALATRILAAVKGARA